MVTLARSLSKELSLITQGLVQCSHLQTQCEYKMSLSVTVTICLSYVSLSFGALEGPIRCPLVWEDYTTGYDLPSDAIPTIDSSENNFIARGKHRAEFRVGRLDTLVNAFIVDDSGTDIVIPVELQILRNQYGCDTEWKKGKPANEFLTSSGGNGTRFVGRGLVNGEYLSGEIDASSAKITIPGKNGVVTLSDFFYLTSSSKGFILQFTELEFTGNPLQGTIDFMGIDTISNGGEVDISQQLTHRKSVTTSYSISHERYWSYASSVSFNFGLSYDFIFGDLFFSALGTSISFGFDLDDSWGSSGGYSYGREDTIEIATERVISVPPFTHVQACTLLGMIEKFSRNYTAVGIYTAKGWTGQEIFDHLNDLPNKPENMQICNSAGCNYVTTTERGTFGGSLFLSNLMIVTNIEESEGCSEMQTIFSKLKEVRAQGRTFKRDTSTEEAALEMELRRILHRGSRNSTTAI